jgi:tRNA(fMet)-specific endonuclease VapC
LRTVVLDTNIVSYLMKGHDFAKLYRAHLEGCLLALSFMTVAELYEGAFRASWGPKKRQVLEEVLKTYLIIPFAASLSIRWAQVRVARKSRPISCSDAWIAATALELDCALVTHNSMDFDGIPGLTLITESPAAAK